MRAFGHLRIEEIILQAGEEWAVAPGAWRFLSVRSGAAYCLSDKPRLLADSELVVACPKTECVIRASVLGEVRLCGFEFAPEMICGFFTMAERNALENTANQMGVVRFLPSTHPASRYFAQAVTEDHPVSSLTQRIFALSLVAALLDEGLIQPRPLAATLGTSALKRFEKIVLCMPDTELASHAPEDLARMCGCSLRHFNRLFRRHFGVGFSRRREEIARRLLEEAVAEQAFLEKVAGKNDDAMQAVDDSAPQPSELQRTAKKIRLGKMASHLVSHLLTLSAILQMPAIFQMLVMES